MPQPQAPPQPATDPFRILLIEPDLALELDFIRALGGSTALLPVDSVPEALRLLREGYAFDLVVANDEAGGVLLLNQLKASVQWRNLPVILTARRVSDSLRQSARHSKALDVYPSQAAPESVRLRVEYLRRKKTHAPHTHRAPNRTGFRIPLGKRLFDVAFAAGVLLALSPLLLVVAALIKFDSPGPVFYRSKRVGAGYRIFDMIKFRTMRQDADKLLAGMASLNIYGKKGPESEPSGLCAACAAAGSECQRPLYLDNQAVCEETYVRGKKAKATFSKFHQDPRVTRLGKFLRDYSIDELPQFINILKGDMSVVGNRPLPLYEAEKLTTVAYARRFAAPAGLTGLWQVTKRGRDTQLSDEERIQLDALYARTYSLRTDLMIILKTARALWQKESM